MPHKLLIFVALITASIALGGSPPAGSEIEKERREEFGAWSEATRGTTGPHSVIGRLVLSNIDNRGMSSRRTDGSPTFILYMEVRNVSGSDIRFALGPYMSGGAIYSLKLINNQSQEVAQDEGIAGYDVPINVKWIELPGDAMIRLKIVDGYFGSVSDNTWALGFTTGRPWRLDLNRSPDYFLRGTFSPVEAQRLSERLSKPLEDKEWYRTWKGTIVFPEVAITRFLKSLNSE